MKRQAAIGWKMSFLRFSFIIYSLLLLRLFSVEDILHTQAKYWAPPPFEYPKPCVWWSFYRYKSPIWAALLSTGARVRQRWCIAVVSFAFEQNHAACQRSLLFYSTEAAHFTKPIVLFACSTPPYLLLTCHHRSNKNWPTLKDTHYC